METDEDFFKDLTILLARRIHSIDEASIRISPKERETADGYELLIDWPNGSGYGKEFFVTAKRIIPDRDFSQDPPHAQIDDPTERYVLVKDGKVLLQDGTWGQIKDED